jgi:transcription initiation factor IIF auxiliary subunit
MTIDMFTTEKGGKTTIAHDLNFSKPMYENIQKVSFKNPSMALQAILRETGPVPSDEERKAKKADGGVKNKKRVYDIEKMADALPQCEEDDLLQVIQMIHDGKADNSFVSNNIDGEEVDVFLNPPPYRTPTEEEEMAGSMLGNADFGRT